jgi:hypothetical protein
MALFGVLDGVVAEGLRSDEASREIRNQILIFLQSNQGKDLLVAFLKEVISRNELAGMIEDVRARVQDLAEEEVSTLAAHAEVALQKSSEDHRSRLDRHAAAQVDMFVEAVLREIENRLQNQRESLISSSLNKIKRKIYGFEHYDLKGILYEAVERHVANGPRFVQSHSNRWLAAALGISLREVKRRRRRGEL